ncbi:nocardicin N-oxygenase [Saccharothrix australiensis]|uniref:Nocardicin N-oxygenase n=2 Tax=Saccharothrix australiensis TaxID=2072 RepID=A0A495W3S2_9PSEU|nr:nocardicin N-oxygenase [Saccharothrix australiensis]
MGPPAECARLRAHTPVAPVRLGSDGVAWYLTRYEDVRAALADPRLIRPDITAWPPGAPPGDAPRLVTMMELDGPGHRALRRAVAEPFGLKAVEALAPRLRALADRLLDDLAAGSDSGDLVTGFAEPFPLLVMCELVGIPYAERDLFLGPADAALGALLTLEAGRSVTGFLRSYALDLAERKRREPGRDVLTDLVRRWDAGDLAEEDVLAFTLSMLVAGYRTTTMFLADALLVLLTHPARLADLRRHPEIMPTAVEELLRHLPVMNANVVLLAEEQVEIADRVVRAGEAVVPSIASANRDERVFAEPDRLDLRRAPNPHLAFGRGVHNCFGAHLARAELAVGLAAVLDRFPHLQLTADPRSLPWEDDSPAKSPLRLPVTWRNPAGEPCPAGDGVL